MLGAKPPLRIPAWPVRLLAGKGALEFMTRSRGITSEKTKRELGWTPRYPAGARVSSTGWTDMSISELDCELRPRTFASPPVPADGLTRLRLGKSSVDELSFEVNPWRA
ncbi:hypothetical protein [Lentzea nigeriaca]|uniref:hypothetical protein n=1 Tax=Lentzea nigeriaca TaxID=1128665 RepID=UPI001956EC86|nr:hypothetical protein [Lentzea nigeriaca]MBM7857307.1 hypothetical protein [Lentzea nigeriaca]